MNAEATVTDKQKLKNYLKANLMDAGILKLADELKEDDTRMLANAVEKYRGSRETLLHSVLMDLFGFGTKKEAHKAILNRYRV